MAFEFITTQLLVDLSILVSVVSVLVIAVSLFILTRKSEEEKTAAEIMATLKEIKNKKSPAAPKKKLAIKPDETSLKEMLTGKFKPKIESQLKTKVHVLDFNAKDENFLALIDISGVKILLTLDSSGKIIDYKKVKKK